VRPGAGAAVAIDVAAVALAACRPGAHARAHNSTHPPAPKRRAAPSVRERTAGSSPRAFGEAGARTSARGRHPDLRGDALEVPVIHPKRSPERTRVVRPVAIDRAARTAFPFMREFVLAIPGAIVEDEASGIRVRVREDGGLAEIGG
jgi:hypothetical protein